MTSQNLKLKGEYRIRVFDKNKTLKSDSDYLPNLITNSGMLFPFSVAFADTFRYLTLGSGSAAPNDYTKTGCEKAIPEFQYLGMYNGLTTLDQSSNFATAGKLLLKDYSEDYYYDPDGCGSILRPDRVELYRTWKVPTGTDAYAIKDYTGDQSIKELTVSPSAPIEQVMLSEGLSGYLPFTPTNDHNLAFSRIVLNSPFSLLQGDYALISYRLSVYPQTGVSFYTKTLQSVTFSKSEGDLIGCTGWTGILTGVYSQIHPGIKLISDKDANLYNGQDAKKALEFQNLDPDDPDSARIPSKGDEKSYFGVSYSPFKIDCPSEPSVIDNDYFYCYLSNDNEQFLANPSGGAIPLSATGKYFPFNPAGIKPGGVHKYIYDLGLRPTDSATKIRMKKSSLTWPDSGNIIVAAPPPSNLSTRRSFSDALISQDYSEPSKIIKFSWGTTAVIQTVSSLVIAVEYEDPMEKDTKYISPFFDMLFSSTTGQMIPNLVAGYNPSLYGYYTPMDNSTGTKLFLDGINNLSLSFKLSWSRG